MSSYKSSSRVTFLDEQHMENYDNESSALHRKLQSKNEALKIIRAELERFRAERDQFKLMAETIQMRYSAIKNSLENCESDINVEGSSSTLGFLLNQSREKNIALQTETEQLRQKLNELQGDIKLLRSKSVDVSKKAKVKSIDESSINEEALKNWNEEKSKLIDQLEGLKKKNAQLQFDFRSLLDEKEEIVSERDVFKCKVHRLTHELNVALKGEGAIDIDSLILENKFLHERIDNLQKELEQSKHSQEKIQTILKTKRVKGALKFGNDKQMIITHKQVTKILSDTTSSEMKAATNADLKALCLGLLDNLNDKSLALSHQKQTNRLLAAKMGTLEEKVRKLSGDSSNSSLLTPSQLLLDNYTSAKVDEDLRTSCLKKLLNVKNVEHSESSRSLVSSEFETQSTSDISSELKQLNYIKIIDDENDLNDYEDAFLKNINSNSFESEEQITALPPDIQKLVDEATRNAEILENKDIDSYQRNEK